MFNYLYFALFLVLSCKRQHTVNSHLLQENDTNEIVSELISLISKESYHIMMDTLFGKDNYKLILKTRLQDSRRALCFENGKICINECYDDLGDFFVNKQNLLEQTLIFYREDSILIERTGGYLINENCKIIECDYSNLNNGIVVFLDLYRANNQDYYSVTLMEHWLFLINGIFDRNGNLLYVGNSSKTNVNESEDESTFRKRMNFIDNTPSQTKTIPSTECNCELFR